MKQRNGQRVLDELIGRLGSAPTDEVPLGTVLVSLGTAQRVAQALLTLKTIHKRLDGLEPTPWTLDEIRSDLSLGGLAVRAPGTVFDGRTARDEGWELANVNGVWVVRRLNDETFGSDAEALIYVAQAAAGGSDYHLAALGFNGRLVDADED